MEFTHVVTFCVDVALSHVESLFQGIFIGFANSVAVASLACRFVGAVVAFHREPGCWQLS